MSRGELGKCREKGILCRRSSRFKGLEVKN